MLSRKDVMDEFDFTREEAAVFLNKVNEINALHLTPIEAMEAVLHHMKKEIAMILLAKLTYNHDVDIKDLN